MPDPWETIRVIQVIAIRAQNELMPDQYLKLKNVVDSTIDDFQQGKLFSVQVEHGNGRGR